MVYLGGKIFRNILIINKRDGVVIYTGEFSSLKRFKMMLKKCKGYDCVCKFKKITNDIQEIGIS